jgi:hypothetical protein
MRLVCETWLGVVCAIGIGVSVWRNLADAQKVGCTSEREKRSGTQDFSWRATLLYREKFYPGKRVKRVCLSTMYLRE